ncbi:MAG TPA: hypothetical protein VFO39_19505 [Candidatus Sulfotelmatobacter sp.]|nr:hypothetical protein [Candidatus Sulfotelmatobacter sp.]
MKNSRKQLRIICFTMAASIVMYAGLAWWLPSSARLNPVLFKAISLVAVSLVVAIAVIRRILVAPADARLASQPGDPIALARWRQGHVTIFALCEAVALYGLVLHFLGGSLFQILPFFACGLTLMLFFAPKAPTRPEFPADRHPST